MLLAKAAGGVEIHAGTRDSIDGFVPPDVETLIAMPPFQRHWVQLVATGESKYRLFVLSISGSMTSSFVTETESGTRLAMSVVDAIATSAIRHVPSERFAQAGQLLAPLPLPALWVLVVIPRWSIGMAPLLLLLGAATVALTLSLSRYVRGHIAAWAGLHDRTRLDLVSRSELLEKRANRKADAKARWWGVTIGAGVTVVVGGAVGWILRLR